MRRLLAVTLCLVWGSAQAADLVPLPEQAPGLSWPTETWPEAEHGGDVNLEALDRLMDRAFSDPAPDDLPGTRAAIVIHRGRLVAEAYATGFSVDRKFLSQSMAKTVVGALVGILVREGKLDVNAPAPVAAWQAPGDARANITLNDLLQMSSGLEFNEDYFNPFTSDVLPMLFGEARADTAAYAASKPLAYEPGTHWSYASGTTNLVSGIVKSKVGGTHDAYLGFMKEELFGPIGMESAEPEFDASGTFIGSSWLHAKARDWARFGLFLLRDGTWDGTRILPEGWVDYMRTPVGHDGYGVYGAHAWLNSGRPEKGVERRIPNLPADAFIASGHRGQFLVMIPSKDLVIVRLGNTGYLNYGDVYDWIGDIASSFPDMQ